MELSKPDGCIFVGSSPTDIQMQVHSMTAPARESVNSWLVEEHSGLLATDRWEETLSKYILVSREAIADLLATKVSSGGQVTKKAVRDERSTESTRTRSVGQAVISIPGIRTYAPWQKAITSVLSENDLLHYPFLNDKYGLWSFVRKQKRDEVIARFLEFYSRCGFGKDNPPSIIAHSFGAYVACSALQQNIDVYYRYIILVGSIVTRSYNWSQLVTNSRVVCVLNERAGRDVWVPLARMIIEDSGPSGKLGFHDLAGGSVIERDHPLSDHSGAFNSVAYSTSWRRFLKTGMV